MLKWIFGAIASVFLVLLILFAGWIVIDPTVADCRSMAARGIPGLADEPEDRFLGKVRFDTGDCRGGEKFQAYRDTPWVDWTNYWNTGDKRSQSGSSYKPITVIGEHLTRDGRGLDGALLDLERQRVELIKFNLFDNYTFEEYMRGRGERNGRVLDYWPEMRLAAGHPAYEAVGGDAEQQVCGGDLIRHRTVTGICNDMINPAMGATGMEFSRNAAFDQTFPRLEKNELAANRHDGRINLMTPDPQVISRVLLTREQSDPEACAAGHGTQCDYKKAPFFNVLAAYWIQFMTHDWFSHLEEGHNSTRLVSMGCRTHRVNNEVVPLSPEDAKALGCNRDAKEYGSLYAQTSDPGSFEVDGRTYLDRAYKTTRNTVTAWWDASQIYGYSDLSRQRVKRDPDDMAKLLLTSIDARVQAGDDGGYLPVFNECADGSAACTPDPINPKWAGQEAVAFPENWSIGMSFYHNLFTREHNAFVDAFRAQAEKTPEADSGLRHPDRVDQAIAFQDVTDDELFEIGRLVVAAMIAKIHTIEWTTQLLYNEPLRTAMFSNWQGLLHGHDETKRIVEEFSEELRQSEDPFEANLIYSIISSGTGIVGTGTTNVPGSMPDVRYSNGGVNHFGSPFNFPEEFISVYRLHPLLPDLLEMRDVGDPNAIQNSMPIIDTFRYKATPVMHAHGIENFALSMGRQRLGALALQNHPQFLQNLEMLARPAGPTKTVDVIALDVLRDRERGIPRFNEFRRQIGLKQLTSFDDFVDQHLVLKGERGELTETEALALADQRKLAGLLRDVYGTHVCDASKIISNAQSLPATGARARPLGSGEVMPNDCLGHPDGSVVDNVEDIDTIVGYLAETTRPHGFAISETQFQIFIINASRRLFSDRFFTSSFRPEYYTQFGIDWVMNSGPDMRMEAGKVNGHRQEVMPLKRVLMRNLPGLSDQLEPVVNAFDPWARDRGRYYSLAWEPIPAAADDPAFAK